MQGYDDDNDNWEYEFEQEYPYGIIQYQIFYKPKGKPFYDEEEEAKTLPPDQIVFEYWEPKPISVEE